MRGPCAKRRVICQITSVRGEIFTGENDCANPQTVCPRAPGEDYTKCRTICDQAGHAEIQALRLAGVEAREGYAELFGHYWICEPCGRALVEAGIEEIIITLPAAV